MKWQMEILSPAPYVSQSNWLVEDSRSKKWTPEENKMFENALAIYDKESPDRWHKVAAMIPGKTVADVIKQYKELELDVSKIEAGLVPIPGYNMTSPFTLDWVNKSGHVFDEYKGFGGKRSSSGRPNEQERKKGVPWTEEEHKLFLLGLKKYGKGDWRNISRNFVITRTPTQVASHAQKYFIRQLSGGKDKRRASIHDITTVSLADTTRTPSPSSEDSKKSISPQMLSQKKQPPFQWNRANAGLAMASQEKMFFSSYGMDSYGIKMECQNLQSDPHNDSSYLGSQTQNFVFQMQSKQQY